MAYLEGEYAQYDGGIGGFDKFDPLLVALHDHLKLFKSDRGSLEQYSNVETSILKLLGANLHTDEKKVVADIIIGIIKQARFDIQRSLSEKLSIREDLHSSLLHFLAYEEIGIAEPVLLNSKQLSNIDILYIIQAKGQDHWQVIAKRPNINDNIIACLVSKKNEKTNIQLLENETLHISENILEKISETAGDSQILANNLIKYKNLPANIATAIYWNVSMELRADIVKKFNIDTKIVDNALEDLIQDFTDTILKSENMVPSKLMIEVAKNYYQENSITEEKLVDSLRRRQGRFFIAMFAEMTHLSYSIVWSMMRQTGGQGLAVACRAKNISKKSFVSIFLITSSFARSHRPVGAEELRMAIRYYEGLTHKMAKEILEDSIAN